MEPKDASAAATPGSPARLRVGVDVVAQDRVERSLKSHGEAFVCRLLDPEERSYCLEARSVERISGRIAAKEAVMKVLGVGWPDVSWTDIVVTSDGFGRPKVEVRGRALDTLRELRLGAIDVSITHDGGLAIAVAVAAGGV